MRETEKMKIKDKSPSQSQNIEDLLEIIEENVHKNNEWKLRS